MPFTALSSPFSARAALRMPLGCAFPRHLSRSALVPLPCSGEVCLAVQFTLKH